MKLFGKISVLLFAMVCAVMCVFTVQAEAKSDSIGWDMSKNRIGNSNVKVSLDETVKYPGAENSIKVVNDDYYCVAVTNTFKVTPGKYYVASAWVKYEGYKLHPDKISDSGAHIGIPGTFAGSATYYGSEWKKHEFVFKAGSEGSIDIALWNGHYGAECKGTAYFCDFKVEEYQPGNVDDKNVLVKRLEAKTAIPGNIISRMDDNYSGIPVTFEFWGEDGLYRVAYCDSTNVYIDILDKELNRSKTIKVKKEYDKLGSVTIDKKGNYYIVYANNDTDNKGNVPVISVVKYSSSGKKLGTVDFTGRDSNWNDKELNFGTRVPFSHSNCDTVIDENGVLVVRYGRTMYNGHQSSYAHYVDTKTMEKLELPSPYISHSFNQKVIVTEDGSYLMAEKGDAFERGITISKVYKKDDGSWIQISFTPFHFRSGAFYQKVYATIAGIEELSNGYALAGTSVKTLSCKVPVENDADDLEARNLFIQIFKKDFSSEDTGKKDVHLLKGSTRKATDTEFAGSSEHGCQPGDIDYGVLWITNYKDDEYASVPKLIKLNSKQLMLLWEKKAHKHGRYCIDDTYISTYYCIVSKDGEFIKKPTEIPGLRISEYTEPVYKDGYVYLVSVPDYTGAYGYEEGDKCEYIISKIKVEIPETEAVAPKAVSKLSVSEGPKDYAKLSWTDEGDADKYVIYRKSSAGGKYKKIGSTTVWSFKDTTKLTQGRTYYYKVKAVYNTGKSVTSKAVTFVPKEIKWDNTVSYTGGVNVSVDRKVKYGSSKYSIKIINTDYECGYAEKTFDVKPNSTYKATVMVKVDGYKLQPGKYYDSGAGIGAPDQYSVANSYSSDWKKLEYVIKTGSEKKISIALWNGMFGADCKGTAYFSGFKLTEVK